MDMKDINPHVIADFRANGGQLSGDMTGLPVLLLTTIGRRSGAEHTTPLGYIEHGGAYVVAASAGGAPSNPDWYHNLVADPTASIEVGTREHQAIARTATSDLRAELFDALATSLPGLADYARSAGREIPVVVLTPTER